MKNRAWIIPTVIFLVLLAAWPFRWEKTPYRSRTTDKGFEEYRFMRDRWTGDWWQIVLGFNSTVDEYGSFNYGVRHYSVTSPVVPSDAKVPDAYYAVRRRRAVATGIWGALLAVSGGWALAGCCWGRKKELTSIAGDEDEE